ncbi:MAG: hypothetical protein KTR32_38200 [Granulosicoccus sp.]|nr:hypothetical protein [Granulosicoccus sp.]
MNKTETAIIHFYQSQELDRDKLALLLQQSPRVRQASWFRRMLPLSAAASLFLLILFGAYFFHFEKNDQAVSIVLQEASINHRSKLQLDFKSLDLQTLARVMDKLDFPIVLPESMRQQFQIVGARYCTLNGNLAAHIKLRNGDVENAVSLFMTQNRKDLKGLADQTEDIDGVNVSSWTADGMFYVLAAH